jgi:glutamate dehydrogenase/leucine dehydrogenase
MSIDELRQLTRLYAEKIGQIVGPNLDVPAVGRKYSIRELDLLRVRRR